MLKIQDLRLPLPSPVTDDITDEQRRRETSQSLILIHIILFIYNKKNKVVFHLSNVAIMCLGLGWFYLSESSSTFVSQVKDVSSLSGQICLEFIHLINITICRLLHLMAKN